MVFLFVLIERILSVQEVFMKGILRAIVWPIIVTFTLQGFGCSGLAHSTTDQVHVQSLDPHARLYVNGQFIGKGSAIATVKRDQPSTLMAIGDDGFCAPAIHYTGSSFNPTSLRDYVNEVPFLAFLADAAGVSQDSGKTSPETYVVTPICSPAA
jgi:hypothetical protein